MRLSNTTSQEQVEALLEAGDDELEDEIENILSVLAASWAAWAEPEEEGGFADAESAMESDAFVQDVQEKSPGEYDLLDVPEGYVKSALSRTRLGGASASAWAAFVYGECPSDSPMFVYPADFRLKFTFDESLPDGAGHIPKDMAEEFWDRLDHDTPYAITWDQTSEIGHNEGHEDQFVPYCIYSTDMDFTEWCRDTISGYIDDLVNNDPEEAVRLFRGYASRSTIEAIDAAKLDLLAGETLDFVHQHLVNADDRDSIEGQLVEYAEKMIDTGEPPEVLVTITKEDLANVNVRKGTFWENAPWHLVKLKPFHLPAEGRRMRHCVGDSGMGYIDAVAVGEVEIWSLRNRNGKPRFTLEVDADKFHHPERYIQPGDLDAVQAEDLYTSIRADAVKQLKGKGNRTPGYAQYRDKDVRFEDEVKLWMWLFDDVLKVDAEMVDDFPALRVLLQRQMDARMEVWTRREQRAFDLADRGEMAENPGRRSFDEPYRPL